jgi:SAM-dependent methyltransferase
VADMDASIPPSWTTGTRPNRFAALPAGAVGRLGGRLMRLVNRAQQREVLGLLGPLVGLIVLEVGNGPGVLLDLLGAAHAAHVVGVDPSLEMRRLAVRTLADRIAAGQVEVRAGDAAATGLPDATVDLAVSVNNVAIWPDLDAGVAELRRVLRPGGQLVLSWHGGERPSRAARGLMLPEERLRRIEDALRERFPAVERALTRRCTVFTARAWRASPGRVPVRRAAAAAGGHTRPRAARSPVPHCPAAQGPRRAHRRPDRRVHDSGVRDLR